MPLALAYPTRGKSSMNFFNPPETMGAPVRGSSIYAFVIGSVASVGCGEFA